MLMSFLLAIHVLLSIAIIVLVLLQQGKGADAGAAFGGSSANFFGSAGVGTFLTKTTTWLAIAFFVISLALAYLITQGKETNEAPSLLDLPAGTERNVPALNPNADPAINNDDLPALPSTSAPAKAATSANDDLPPAPPATTTP